MKRAAYSNTISDFLKESKESILGKLTSNHSNRSLEELQIKAWEQQIAILKDQLRGINGNVYFEFAIPRMGKKVDNIIIIGEVIFVVEFKVGSDSYNKNSQEQVIDYTLDLQNFHEGSHSAKLIPVLVATNAGVVENNISEIQKLNHALKCNKVELKKNLAIFIDKSSYHVDSEYWENSIYKPTPTIIEAAKALYRGHKVEEISRSDAGAINLTKTAACLNGIIEKSKREEKKSICFVTGVPGAGKTLAGLNIANERMKANEAEHAVFLSGNGPLVDVLREALARDEVDRVKKTGQSITKKKAAIKANAFIQNIHHFRDDNLKSEKAPVEKVVVFDEAQRAWDKHQASSFMRRKKGIEDFDMSEPDFLIDVMDRHDDWCVIICLIGGGQEINTGEAGLEEWVNVFKNKYLNWDVYYSDLIIASKSYIQLDQQNWLKEKAQAKKELHLDVSIRSFRSERLSEFIYELLELNFERSKFLYQEIKAEFPLVITRDLSKAKTWVKDNAKGSERIGLIASSGARRLRPLGIYVKNEISPANWFLNDALDVRSSYFLEEVATEFDIQGLEIDWSIVAWGANFYLKEGQWKHQNFKGSKWQNINKKEDKEYLKNAYRVLLTRSRQGFVIYIPQGSKIDKTRKPEFYDETYEYMKRLGIKELM